MLKKNKTFIKVTFKKEGIHRYPDAASNPDLKDVSFLAYPHRHIFHFAVHIEVFHDDRDLEFILVKREIESWYDAKFLELDYKSCEMISDELANHVSIRWPNRDIKISVDEDGENGSETYYSWCD